MSCPQRRHACPSASAIAVVALASCLVAGPAAAAPGAGELRPEAVEAAARYSREKREISLIVLHRGRVLLEEYPGGEREAGFPIASCSKSLWGLAAAAAAQDGLLDWDEPVVVSFPEWKSDARKARVRVRDLLSMTSGLDPGYEALYTRTPDDAQKAALELPAISEPGQAFVYGPANMEVFGALLRKKLANRGLTPLGYLERRVLGPIGSGYRSWVKDRAGRPAMSSGAQLTARQLMAVGRLIARRGLWGGRRLLVESAIQELFRGSVANPAYGLTFWLNANAARADAQEVDFEKVLALGRPYEAWRTACVSKAAPADLVVMVGSYNQRVYVSPSLDLVVVRQGNGTEFSDPEFLGRLFRQEPARPAAGTAQD